MEKERIPVLESFRNDVFDTFVDYVFEESSSEVDGKHVIGKVRGQFFVLNGLSRNERYYGSAVWEKLLGDKKFQENLGDRRFFGTISHEQVLSDEALRDGKVSHILTKIWIDGSKGMGEALILGTDAGKNLNTYLRAGSKLYVSSRANGRYKGYTEKGVPCVDPDAYQFESFDFVKEPGFFEARPTLSESINNQPSEEKEEPMEQKDQLLESLIKERSKFEEDIRSSLKQLEDANNKIKALEEANTKTNAELMSAKEQLLALKSYQELGDAQDVKYALKLAEGFSNKIKTIGDLDQIRSMLSGINSLKESLKVSTLDEAVSKFNALSKENESYQKLGKADEITKAFMLIEKQQDLFKFVNKLDVKKVKENAINIRAYRKLGTAKQIQEAFNKTAAYVGTIHESNKKVTVQALASELKIEESVVSKLLDTMSPNEIKTFITGMKKSDSLKETYSKKIGSSSMNESASEKRTPFSGSRVSRLIQVHSGKPATTGKVDTMIQE